MAADSSITSGRVISTEQVNDTQVFSAAGEPLGTVASLMIDKISGRAIYAMMSFDASLEAGAPRRQLPWSTLKYDQQKSGYVLTAEMKRPGFAFRDEAASGIEWSPQYGHSLDDF